MAPYENDSLPGAITNGEGARVDAIRHDAEARSGRDCLKRLAIDLGDSDVQRNRRAPPTLFRLRQPSLQAYVQTRRSRRGLRAPA
jgi:hypothetical protein